METLIVQMAFSLAGTFGECSPSPSFNPMNNTQYISWVFRPKIPIKLTLQKFIRMLSPRHSGDCEALTALPSHCFRREILTLLTFSSLTSDQYCNILRLIVRDIDFYRGYGGLFARWLGYYHPEVRISTLQLFKRIQPDDIGSSLAANLRCLHWQAALEILEVMRQSPQPEFSVVLNLWFENSREHDPHARTIIAGLRLLDDLESRFPKQLNTSRRREQLRRRAGSEAQLAEARTVLGAASETQRRQFFHSAGELAYPVLFDVLDALHADETLVLRALSILSELRTDRSEFIYPVLQLLLRKEIPIRIAALRFIGSIGSAQHTPPVAALLFDTPLPVIYEAARTLARIGGRWDSIPIDLALNTARQLRHASYFVRLPLLIARYRLEQRLIAERSR